MIAAEILERIDFDKFVVEPPGVDLRGSNLVRWVRSRRVVFRRVFERSLVREEIGSTVGTTQVVWYWRSAVYAAEICDFNRAKSRATDLARHPEWLE